MTSKYFPNSQLNVNVTLFSGVAGHIIGDYPLVDVLSLMQADWAGKIFQIRNEQDEEKQKEMKKQLPCFTASCTCSGGHAKENITGHSGFLGIDIDWGDNTHIPSFAVRIPQIARSLPWCAYCGRSARGKGFFLLVRIKDPDKHEKYWKSLNGWFWAKHGIKLDSKVKNPNALRFVSYDIDAYWNHSPAAFGYTLQQPPHTTPVPRKNTKYNSTSSPDVSQLCREIDRRGIDITANYDDWYKVGFALASLGESGRELYHVVSRQNPGYNYTETDKKFTNLVQHSDGRITIATFFDLCKKYGVKN